MSTLLHRIRSLILLLALATPALAQQHEFISGKNSLKVEFPHGHVYQYGFQWVRITATNVDTKPATWKANLQEQVFNYGMRSDNTSARSISIEVTPGDVVQRDILMVMGNQDISEGGGYWNDFTINVVMPSGIKDAWNHRADNTNSYHYSGSGMTMHDIPVLYSEVASTTINDTGLSYNSKSAVMKGAHSTDWRAYSPFALVVMSPQEWEAMIPAARMALMDWVRLGGSLQFTGSIPDSVPERSTNHALGLGEIHSHADTDDDYSLESTAAYKYIRSKRVDLRSKPQIEEKNFTQWLREHGMEELLEDSFAIWLVVLVLIAFFVMMTPVNLFLFAPSRRRHRLFKTIPLISLVACLALTIAVVTGDGIGGQGQRLVLIESRSGDENLHYISQWQASDCGALFGSSFKVSDPAYLAPLGELSSETSLDIVADGLEAGGGWFSSRAVQSQHLQAVRSSRGRIEWSADADSNPTVISTFDFDLVDFHTRDQSGKWWHAAKLSKGKPVQLKPTESRSAHKQIGKLIAAMPNEERVRKLSDIGGRYIASTDQPSAIDTHGSIDWTDTGIVIGEIVQP